ncbi:hypothetical protein V5799_010984 [Amblyomma americanum]|uniref:T-box domain-containing protein n=1 Tax=Amblyomma americanum TaxID=6943 RepID=A0AAQ4EII3_AMBAM
MRKYVPRVHVFAGSDVQHLDYRRFKTFVFPETSFISVTSYQSEQIIALKIQNNPYARSFCTNGDRRSVLKRLLDEESASDEDINGNSSKFRPLISLDGPEVPRSSPPRNITATTATQQRVLNSCPALVTSPAIPPYPCPYSPQPCFSYPAYATCLDWCPPLYGLGHQPYGYADAVGSCRSYVPSPYLSPAATASLLPPIYLPTLSASQSVGAMSVTSGLSVTSSLSASSAAATSLLSSATSPLSSAATVSSATPSFPIMSLSSADGTAASQPSLSNATL